MLETFMPTGPFSWPLGDGTYLSLNASSGSFCPDLSTKSLLSQRSLGGSGYTYHTGPTAVTKNAVGVPLLDGVGFFQSLGIFYISNLTEFRWASICMPVVSTNPVKCQTAGAVTVSTNAVSVSDGDCNITTPIYAVNPEIDGASGSGGCTEGHGIGQSTILMGSVNEHASKLAELMQDTKFLASANQTYSVSCSIDVAPSMVFKQVNFSVIEGANIYTGASYQLDSTGESCDPIQQGVYLERSDILTNTSLAYGASGLSALLSETAYIDGWWETIEAVQAAFTTLDSYDYVFADSTNPLEDVLGLATGLSLGFYWGSSVYNAQFTPNGSIHVDNGQAGALGVRVGPGQALAIVYILPSFFALFTLVRLVSDLHRHRSEGGAIDPLMQVTHE
jgi:hypothetical protein